MSHFTVLIATDADGPEEIEDKVEQALAPYFEGKEDVEPYWTDEAPSFESWWDREYHVKEGNVPADVTFEDFIAYLQTSREDETLYRLTEDGKVERQSTYNPLSKWDWYQIGGRWTGNLRLKQTADATAVGAGRGGRAWGEQPELEDVQVDFARKGDLDIDGVRQDAEDRATLTWAKVQAIIDQHGEPTPFGTLVVASGYDVLEDKSTDEAKALIQSVRDQYNGQPAIVAAKEAGLLEDFFSNWDDLFGGFTGETYVRYHRNRAVGGFAFLGGEVGWMEPGRMGWWGMSTDESEDRIAYADKLAAIIDLIPDSEYLVMVDCHI